jgi:hypothetical protein
MDIKSVQNRPIRERRDIRINLRITKSQDDFIIKNNLSVTKIMNEALKQLGYDESKATYTPRRDYGGRRGKGNVRAQKTRARAKKRTSYGRK